MLCFILLEDRDVVASPVHDKSLTDEEKHDCNLKAIFEFYIQKEREREREVPRRNGEIEGNGMSETITIASANEI